MSRPDPTQIHQYLSELSDYNKDRRRTAVMKLGLVGGDEAVKALIMALQNRNEDLIVRGRAALMLGRLGDTRAVQPLINALDAPGMQTPLHAARSLGRLGDDRAIEPLLLIAGSADGKLHAAAMEALQRLGCGPEPASPEA